MSSSTLLPRWRRQRHRAEKPFTHGHRGACSGTGGDDLTRGRAEHEVALDCRHDGRGSDFWLLARKQFERGPSFENVAKSRRRAGHDTSKSLLDARLAEGLSTDVDPASERLGIGLGARVE